MWRVWRRKPVESMRYDENQVLQRTIKTVDLFSLGVGTSFGAGSYPSIAYPPLIITLGILLEVSQICRDTTGPAVIVSYVIAGLATLLTALAYAEFAAKMPVAGSVYSYTYSSLGELCGWIVGWDLTLEYLLSAAIVARGMSQYLIAVFGAVGIEIPMWSLVFPYSNMPFQFDILACTLVLIIMLGVGYFKERISRVNSLNTLIALLVLIVVICAGIPSVKPSNYTPFAPFQFYGIAKGASIAMLAFVGFDTMSMAAEETENPRKTVPIAMIGTVVFGIFLYTATTAILAGQMNYNQLDTVSPLSNFFLSQGMEWIRVIAGIAAIFMVLTNIYGTMFAQSRILMSLSRDGLVWPWFGEISKKSFTPLNSILSCGVLTAILAGFVDLSILADLVAVGVIVSYIAVNASVLSQRYSTDTSNKKVGITLLATITGLILMYSAAANLHRIHYAFLIVAAAFTSIPVMLFFLFPKFNSPPIGFQCPGVPFIPLISIALNVWVLYTLSWLAWARFAVWLGIGLIVYFMYGVRNSNMLYDKKSDRFFDPSFDEEGEATVFARLTGEEKNLA